MVGCVLCDECVVVVLVDVEVCFVVVWYVDVIVYVVFV